MIFAYNILSFIFLTVKYCHKKAVILNLKENILSIPRTSESVCEAAKIVLQRPHSDSPLRWISQRICLDCRFGMCVSITTNYAEKLLITALYISFSEQPLTWLESNDIKLAVTVE
jgi:hypothetical protein